MKEQTLKETLKENNNHLQSQFEDGVDISRLLKTRSETIDHLLNELWVEDGLDKSLHACLVAVGGYGREEMHPASDVDLLILLGEEPESDEQEKLSDFVTHLWDLGLEIGHSVRTLDECATEASDDLTVITNMIESRFLSGDKALFDQLHQRISPHKLWNSRDFFNAKIVEQNNRYKRYGDTAYRVEPNLKEGPGGLRDLQTIGWIVLREYGIYSLKELTEAKDNDLLDSEEYRALIEARNFLWKVRFALHQLTGRKEDRLLFDHQRQLAHSFGYTNDENNQSIEAFMQRYYRTITNLERLNEILLGLLRERILETNQTPAIPINKFYANQNGFLALLKKDILKTHPHTLLEVFNIIQIRPELKGMTPETIRQLRRNLHLIDDGFRNNIHNKQMFIAIISESHGINFVLRRMNRYGVLAAYIPAFANIVGRMQYDLFHAYTVDEHILHVVRNTRRLSTQAGAEELPFCSKIFSTLQTPMILYLAGLFHDIAKGRGGSHSELGAIDALEFCRAHDLQENDAKLVSWLVKQHLLLSTTAQRKDINDPDVIDEFSTIMKNKVRLDFLYLLTICDIKGTNPTLLNSWKHSLLKDLYLNTKSYLQADDNKTAADLMVQEIKLKKQKVFKQLEQTAFNQVVCEAFWSRFDLNYLLQYTSSSLAKHIIEITQYNKKNENIIRIDNSESGDSTELFIYTRDTRGLFVKITSAIEQHNLNTVAANITSSKDEYDLYTFYLLTNDGALLENKLDKAKLLATIENNLAQETLSYDFNQHRIPRQLKHFETTTSVEFSQDKVHQQTIVTLRAADRAGLLTRIGEVFNEQGLMIHDARISTLGEIAEDIFHVSTQSGDAILNKAKLQRIHVALEEKLNS